ncbi:MAG: FecR family protein, partial [Elsteraceae bacterium]
MHRLKIGVAAISVLAFLPAAIVSSAQAQEKSGVAAAVNPNAVSTPPGQTSRTLLIGADVIFRERIATQADGQVQLIFLDESSLTVGPGSDVTIDEFVYDPRAKTGKMSVKITGGLVRFVGGRISKSGDVSINTPVSVIGVRGGMGYVEVTATSATATNLFGTLSVKGATGGEQIISRPGFAVTTAQGQLPGTPIKVDAAQLVRLSRSLEAPPQAAARNASGAIEGKLDRSQVSEKNSSQEPGSISPEASAQRAEASRNPSGSDPGLVRQAVQQNVTSTVQNSVIGSAGGLSGEFF